MGTNMLRVQWCVYTQPTCIQLHVMIRQKSLQSKIRSEFFAPILSSPFAVLRDPTQAGGERRVCAWTQLCGLSSSALPHTSFCGLSFAAGMRPIIGLTLMLRCGGGRGARADHRVEAHALDAVVRARRYQVDQIDDEHKDAPAMHHTPQHTPHHRERRVPHTTAYAASP